MNSPAHPLLAKLTGPTSMAVVFGLFAVYALIRLFVFPWTPIPGMTDPQPILLGSQFALLLCFVALIRALRDGRIFECFFVVFLAMPAVSTLTNAVLMVAAGMQVDLESLKKSSLLFSPLVWMGLGVQGLLLGALLLWQRWRKA
jgi:hypothetical protein